ncbi:MAG: phosphoribosylamine--glycine ligase [Burkholderiales bacterium]|jgi:phosphoribosylamine--glycine ligase|nr:phosphoribosylamine--glycine ligase [Burkholderiales bacterium]
MKLLVIGSGGREHALAWKLASGPRVQKVYVAPGNAGTALEPGVENVAITDLGALADFAEREKIYLTVVGPEAPLAAGVVDLFRSRGLRIFGPTKAAAQLESSKDFAKRFLVRHAIPTAAYETFTDAAAARSYVSRRGAPIVVKADGLAAGKGVVVATSVAEAHRAIDEMLVGNRMGDAGARVVVEDFLDGEEASFIVMADGEHVLPLATSQDHKRLRDGDAGPNTGGMGAYSPAPVVTPALHARVVREIILPAVRGMRDDGLPYSGFLYAGLMIDAAGNPKVLEFNCRLGDPETQPILMRLKSDLLELFDQALAGGLDKAEAEWDRRAALGVVLAAANYPETPRKGDVISGLPPAAEDCHVFHAGTAVHDGKVVTAGGRVLCVTGLGDSIKMAQRRAYQAVDQIRFEGMQLRRDIGFRAIAAKRI